MEGFLLAASYIQVLLLPKIWTRHLCFRAWDLWCREAIQGTISQISWLKTYLG